MTQVTKDTLAFPVLKSHKDILVWCKSCKKHETVTSRYNHYCSKECAHQAVVEYWRNRWPKRKHDPIARAHTAKAKSKWAHKKRLERNA